MNQKQSQELYREYSRCVQFVSMCRQLRDNVIASEFLYMEMTVWYLLHFVFKLLLKGLALAGQNTTLKKCSSLINQKLYEDSVS